MSDFTRKDYDEAIQRIRDAADAVDEAYKVAGNAASTLCDVNQTVEYNPNITVIRNNNGDVVGYDYKYTTPYSPNLPAINVDSNNDHGSFGSAEGGGGSSAGGGAGRDRSSTYAGSVNTDQQSTDKMTGIQGFVSGIVDKAWAVTSALAKFGKQVNLDAADFIEATGNNFEEQFGALTIKAGAQGLANAIRVLYGVDDNGNTVMYMDEDTIGAMGISIRDNGGFETGEQSATWPYTTRLPNYAAGAYSMPVAFTSVGTSFSTSFRNSANNATITFTWTNMPADTILVGAYNPDYPTRNSLIFACKRTGRSSIIVNRHEYVVADNGTIVVDQNYNEEFYPSGISQSYMICASGTKDLRLFSSPVVNLVDFSREQSNPGIYDELATVALYGDVHSGTTVPGMSDQTGATIPVDAITGADPHVVAQNLVNNYPDLMGSPVQVVVMDDSCNEKTINYYSVPISYSPTNLNVNAPITGGLQVSPSFNPNVGVELPDVNIDHLIDQIVRQLDGSGAGRDVTEEDPTTGEVITEPPTIPNTGTGTTPPSVMPEANVTAMWHVYNPSSAALSSLGGWLWSANIIDQIVRMFANPMEAIIGVHAIYTAPTVGSQNPVVVGNLTSPVNANVVTNQYLSLDCGTVNVLEYFGNVFDYDPFTKISLYLPFIGIVPLRTSDVMRSSLHIVYNVDVYTGACTAMVEVTRDGVGGVLYQFSGNCAVEYPVSGANYSRMLQAALGSCTASLASGMVTGGNPILGAIAAGTAFTQGKIDFQRSGSFSGNPGAMGPKIPYLIISRPQPNMADLYQLYDGRGSNFTTKLKDCRGYTKCKVVHLNVPGAYHDELLEIERLLKEGVVFPGGMTIS